MNFLKNRMDIFLLLRFNVRHLRTFLQKMHYAKLDCSSVRNSVLICQEECIYETLFLSRITMSEEILKVLCPSQRSQHFFAL
ncbi:hypothetical protein ALC57_10568 [Trachymyrmex cornetzi]|uniref:Uncharacterized protein n=1 Tax=Trachymyrmex cornetzi TaxID=471704 RepID=A0A151J3Z1_9HYME|nr:hypothetical protein ALC57_10568 [Trachymyrmex cornetzi]